MTRSPNRWSPGTRTCGWSTTSSRWRWPRPASPSTAQIRPATAMTTMRPPDRPTATMTTPAQTAAPVTAAGPGASQAAPAETTPPAPRPAPAAGPGSGSPPTRCRHCGTPSPGSPSTSSPAPPASPPGSAPPSSPPLHHPVAAAGHRLLRLHPGQHPPRRPAPRPRLRLAPLRPPAAWCDVHHLQHKTDGGTTSVSNCVLLCQFHHDICIHRRGWRLVLHPDGTTTAYGPDGQVLHSHSPPTLRAG